MLVLIITLLTVETFPISRGKDRKRMKKKIVCVAIVGSCIGIESLVLKLSAATMGTFVGTFCGYLLQTNMALMTELPAVFLIDWSSIIRVFTLSVAIGIIGMYFILIRLSRQSIMDIFRQTF